MVATGLAIGGPLAPAPANVLWWLAIAMLLFKAFALVDAVTRREDAYRATGKRTKPFWLVILGLAVLLDIVLGGGVFSVFGLAGLVAAIVYVVDVRPAIRAITGGRGGDGGRRTGPYGPW